VNEVYAFSMLVFMLHQLLW